MRALLLSAILVGLASTAAATTVGVRTFLDDRVCPAEGVCWNGDNVDERGDPTLAVTITVDEGTVAGDLAGCDEGPCPYPESWASVTVDVWTDSNGCDGVQEEPHPQCRAADPRDSTTLGLP